jgi:hypothetical protein
MNVHGKSLFAVQLNLQLTNYHSRNAGVEEEQQAAALLEEVDLEIFAEESDQDSEADDNDSPARGAGQG